MVDSGALGESLFYVRGRYGHGGRIGYDKRMALQIRRYPAAAS